MKLIPLRGWSDDGLDPSDRRAVAERFSRVVAIQAGTTTRLTQWTLAVRWPPERRRNRGD